MPRGGTEIPRGLKKDWRKLAEAMRDAGWTFGQGGKHVVAYAFRRWCRQQEIPPGI